MRVLFVSGYPHLPDIRGGLQTTTHDLCLALKTAGAEAAVLCGVQAGTGLHGRSRTSDERLGYLTVRAQAPDAVLGEVARAWQADVVVVQSGTGLLPTVVGSLKAGLPTAIYLHNVETYVLQGHLVPDPALLFLANSNFTAERWRGLCGVHCAVVPPVVAAEHYLAGARGGKVLFVNPTPIKGVERMFVLAARCPDIPFLVVESWPLEPTWRRWCQHRARALGNIEWREPTDDMRPVYASARMLLMPSVCEEAFGRTVVEAQLNGLPVLASRRGALEENVGAGGWVLDAHAADQAWEEALRRLYLDHGAVFSAAAREKALGHVAATPLIVADLLGLLATHAASAVAAGRPDLE